MMEEATIPIPAQAAPYFTAAHAAPTEPGPVIPPVSATPVEALDIRALVHPAEDSRLLLALSASAVVFGFAAMVVYASAGWTMLVEGAGYLTAAGVSLWLSLQIYRSRLLGGAVRVTETTLPELQSVLDEVRVRLNYHKPVDVYVLDKVAGGSAMTSYLGTRLIQIDGGLAADLLGEEHRAELRYMIGRHIGQLKARHQRLWPILVAISTVNYLKFLQFFLAPYYRATAKSGDQIGAACCGDIQATAVMMNRLLVGKELGPRLLAKGILDQAAIVRRRWLPRLAQLFMSEPHSTNRYLNLLAFFARVAPQEIARWRASLDEGTASRLTAAIRASAHKRAPRRRMNPVSVLVATLISGGLLALGGWAVFGLAAPAAAAQSPGGATQTPAAVAQTPAGHPSGTAGSPQPGSAIAATLTTYFEAINTRDYRAAWDELSAANQAANPYEQFAAGLSSSTVQDAQLHGIAAGSGPGTYVAAVTFQSHQDPSQSPDHSDSCDNWTLDYTMIQSSGRWLIDRASPAPGVPEYQSCG